MTKCCHTSLLNMHGRNNIFLNDSFNHITFAVLLQFDELTISKFEGPGTVA